MPQGRGVVPFSRPYPHTRQTTAGIGDRREQKCPFLLDYRLARLPDLSLIPIETGATRGFYLDMTSVCVLRRQATQRYSCLYGCTPISLRTDSKLPSYAFDALLHADSRPSPVPFIASLGSNPIPESRTLSSIPSGVPVSATSTWAVPLCFKHFEALLVEP
jgi:hypothetical protein